MLRIEVNCKCGILARAEVNVVHYLYLTGKELDTLVECVSSETDWFECEPSFAAGDPWAWATFSLDENVDEEDSRVRLYAADLAEAIGLYLETQYPGEDFGVLSGDDYVAIIERLENYYIQGVPIREQE